MPITSDSPADRHEADSLGEARPTPTWRTPSPGAPAGGSSSGPPTPRGGQDSSVAAINQAVQEHSAWVRPLQDEIARGIVGQKYLIDRLLGGLLTNGHL